MKTTILILKFLVLTNFSFGQTFIGTQTEKFKRYNCTIRVNKDSTINFIYHRDKNGVYVDHKGTIKKLNNTLYRISATMTIGQFYMKSYDNDNIYIKINPNIARQLDKIQIEYANGKNSKQLQGYDRFENPIGLLKIPVDKKLFNAKIGTNFITITINRKNFLSDNFLSFRIPYGSAASFTSGKKTEFNIVIKGNQLWTVGKPPLQTGYFKLKKKSGT